MRPSLFLLLILTLTACSSDEPRPRTDAEYKLFSPVSMQLETFTGLKNWTTGGVGAPDGIEAVVEFDDQFGDRTKASGTILFELYKYRPGWPDPRGGRMVNPWLGSLKDIDDQKAHWERASGAYSFRLSYVGLAIDENYILTASFQGDNGQRFTDQIVVPYLVKPEGKHEHHRVPTSIPSRSEPAP